MNNTNLSTPPYTNNVSTFGSFKVVSINVNSIISLNKRYDLCKFISLHNPDIVLICETKLNPRHKITFANYNMIRSDRTSNQGGGTAILIKNNIKFETVFFPSSKNNSFIEYTIIKINLPNNNNLFFVALYANNREGKGFISEISHLYSNLELHNDNNFFLMAGDLNARNIIWGDSITKFKGNLLRKWENTEGLQYRINIIPSLLPSFPSANSFLDLTMIDNRLKISNLLNNKIKTSDYNSDHLALLIELTLPCNLPTQDPLLTHKLMFKKTKWKKFTKTLGLNHQEPVPSNINLTNDEINTHIEKLDSLILNTIEEVVPKYRPNDNILTYTNSKIKKLHKIKSFLITARNQKYKTHPKHHEEIAHIKQLLNHTNRLIKNEYHLSYNKHWDTMHKKIDHTKSDSFFPNINRFFRPKGAPSFSNILIEQNDVDLLSRCNIDHSKLPKENNKYLIHSPHDIISIIGAYLETINMPRHTNINTNIAKRVNETTDTMINSFTENVNSKKTITNFTSTNIATNPTTIENSIFFYNTFQINKILKTLPNKSSSGINNIPPIVLKHLHPLIIQDYTTIFNNCLNNRYYPDTWKTAKLLPLLKKGKPPNTISSYRPISLTPAISKVFEIVLSTSLRYHVDKQKIIPDNQYGFRRKLSTTHAIHKVTTEIHSHLHKGETVGACLIDLEKAFDSVWIRGLLYIMRNLGFSLDLIQTVWSMTSNREFFTWNGTIRSETTFQIQEGLMQGAVLSPELFNIFTSALPMLFNMNKGSSYSCTFADDFIVMIGNKHPSIVQKNLEALVNHINNWYINWNLRINPNKCETIIFHKPLRFLGHKIREEIKTFQIAINSNGTTHLIENKKAVKYLGVTLDHFLKFVPHIINQLNKAKTAFKTLSHLFFSKSLSHRVKVLCYMILIRPIITYASPIWWNMSASLAEKMRKFERHCLRVCLHLFRKPDSKQFFSSKMLYDKANIPRIDSFITKLNRNYFAELKNIKNNFLQKFLDNHNFSDEASTGSLPAHAFVYFDRKGYIQDTTNNHILYHYPRHQADKSIRFKLDNPQNLPIRYCRSLPNCDLLDFHRINKKYWWLADDAKFLDEIRRRKIHLTSHL